MILILGGFGYVGQAYQIRLTQLGVEYKVISRSEFDYLNPSILKAVLATHKVEFLINAAGFTGKPNVDACEAQKSLCLQGNAVLPGIIGEVCADAGVPWGHISSGCIYTGSKPGGAGFTELDSPNFTFRQNNCSFYSGSKALGEEAISHLPNVYIWRLRIPFNYQDGPRNYLSKVMRYDRLLNARNSLSELDEFVNASLLCWQKRIPFGIYNVTNPGSVTTVDVVNHIKKSGVINKSFSFFESEPEFMKLAAKTPRSNCVLSSDKLASMGIAMTEVNEAIIRDLKLWNRTYFI
jgi:dTDP-4-dehydrorhamnose reductase